MNKPLEDFDWKTQRSAINPDVWHSKGLDDSTVVAIRRALVLAEKISKLNPNAQEIGAGMLAQIVFESCAILNKEPPEIIR